VATPVVRTGSVQESYRVDLLLSATVLPGIMFMWSCDLGEASYGTTVSRARRRWIPSLLHTQYS